MSKCGAGDCEIECGGTKGCGCIAESDEPMNCHCYCFGDETTGGLTLDPGTAVDVSIHDLPLFDAAKFLAAASKVRILVPADAGSAPVDLQVTRTSLKDVLRQLGLETAEGGAGAGRGMALLMFLVGVAVGALIVAVVF